MKSEGYFKLILVLMSESKRKLMYQLKVAPDTDKGIRL
jgi:hypothetical protein